MGLLPLNPHPAEIHFNYAPRSSKQNVPMTDSRVLSEVAEFPSTGQKLEYSEYCASVTRRMHSPETPAFPKMSS